MDGAHHIEVELELAVALRKEVVFHASPETVLGIPSGVGHLMEKGLVVLIFKFLVGKFCQNHNALLGARIELSGGTAGTRHGSMPPAVGPGPPDGSVPLQLLHVCLGKLSAGRWHVACPVGSLPIVQMLVAHQTHAHLLPILKSDRSPHTALGGYGT